MVMIIQLINQPCAATGKGNWRVACCGWLHAYIYHTIEYTTATHTLTHLYTSAAPKIHKVQCMHTYTGREVKESPRAAVACFACLLVRCSACARGKKAKEGRSACSNPKHSLLSGS